MAFTSDYRITRALLAFANGGANSASVRSSNARVEACLKAKIATGEIVHIDASLIRADVSWESLVERHVGEVIEENKFDEEMEAEKRGRQSGKYKKISTTDPDATMSTSVRVPGDRDHRFQSIVIIISRAS